MSDKEMIIKKIKELIAEEKWCMAGDRHIEQEIEHINQIEMANKCIKIVEEVLR